MSILSICIKANAAGIGIPASNISVRYRTAFPYSVTQLWYLLLFHSGPACGGKTPCM